MATDTLSNPGSPGPSIREGGYDFEPKPLISYGCGVRSPSENAEIERLRRELDDSLQRIDRDTGVINSLYEKVTELEELVKKQKVTISTQSRTISDRRHLRKHQQQSQQGQSPIGNRVGVGMYPMTPSHHHHVHHGQYAGSGASGVSCSGGGMCLMQNTASPFEQAQVQTPLSVKSVDHVSQCSTVFDQPPPKFGISCDVSYSPYASSTHAASTGLTPSLSNGKDVFSSMSSMDSGVGFVPSPGLCGSADYHKEMATFSNKFLSLMRMSEIFGQSHAGLPNIFMDSHMSDHVKDYLMAIAVREKASDLLGSAATRGFFVAKAINWYLVEQILDTNVIKGFDATVDCEVSQIQQQLTSAKGTPFIRHVMLTTLTTHIRALSKRPNFSEFVQQRIQSHLNTLWTYIGPLGHDTPVHNSPMWLDLSTIVAEAHSLALDMYSVPLEYRFEFPEQSEPFDPLTMINRDPYVNGDPSALKNDNTRVRLGVTPIVRIRNNSQGPGEVHLMYLGHVLLKGTKQQQQQQQVLL
ncbi:hypothetical protein BDV18DRAFT_157019 [Aspergillus unguis]